MHILSQNHCNHPGRNELRESKGTPTPLDELMVPKGLEFPRSLLLGLGNSWSLVPARRVACLLKGDFTQFWQFARIPCNETLVLRQWWWLGPCLDQDCLAMYISDLVLKAKPHIRTEKMDSGEGVNVVPLFLFLMWRCRQNHCSLLLLVGFILMRIRDQTWVIREARADAVTLNKSTKTHRTMPGCGEKPWENLYCWQGIALSRTYTSDSCKFDKAFPSVYIPRDGKAWLWSECECCCCVWVPVFRNGWPVCAKPVTAVSSSRVPIPWACSPTEIYYRTS